MKMLMAGLGSALVFTASPVFAGVAAQTNAPAASATAVSVEVVATGLAFPWGVAVLPDGRFLISERGGKLKIVSADGRRATEVSGVPAVEARGQGGLLDVALSPGFAVNRSIYLTYSEPRSGGGNGTAVAKATLETDGDVAKLGGVTVIFQQEPAVKSQFHFGSRVVFDRDGNLFVTTGERAVARDQAQNPANHIGKIIHIAPDGAAAPGNPGLAGWEPRNWSIGHRNIQGAALDPATGQLWTVEHGAKGGDELNSPQAGKNYGWPVITYGRDYSGEAIGEGKAKPGLEQPVYYWDPSIAVSGMVVYDGALFQSWKGNLIVGALKGAHLQRLVIENGKVVAQERLLEDLGERIRDVRQAPDGSLLVLTDAARGQLLRVTPKR